MIQSSRKAVFLIAHASKARGFDAPVKKIIKDLRASEPKIYWGVCYLGNVFPDISQAFEIAKKKKCLSLIFLPYFVLRGSHVQKDIPAMIKQGTRAYPEMHVQLKSYLGYDPLLSQLVRKRLS